MMLIGVTAVEDKLQNKVPETIADFLKASTQNSYKKATNFPLQQFNKF